MKSRTFARMTPDKRLNQLEPVVADTAQKVDRLIETNGQILDLAIRGNATAKSAAQKADMAAQKADSASRNAELAARGVAALTVDFISFKQEVRQNFQRMDQRFEQVEQKIDSEVGALRQTIDDNIGGLRQEMNQRFDQLVTLIQNRL